VTTDLLHSPTHARGDDPREGRRTTRLGAGLGVAGIALIVGGFALIAATDATITSSREEIAAFYTGSSLSKLLTGGLLECLGFVLLLPFAAMLSDRVHGRGPAAQLLPTVARMAATVYVSICLVPGMAAGGAALWLAHHGTTDAAVLQALNTLRGFSYFLALLFFATFLVCVGVPAVATRALPRWASWSAIGIGVALGGTIPLADAELPDMLGLLALLWVAVVGVHLLRRPGLSVRQVR
jgi:hypothetical protein